MKKFAIKLTIFLLPIIIVLVLVEHALQARGDDYTQKKKMFLNKLNDIEVVSVGTSHGYRGINPKYFDYAGFNMGERQQPLYYDEKIVSKYLKYMKKLKLVIQPIDCFALEGNPNIISTKFMYSKYYGIPVQNMDIKDLLSIKNYSLIALNGGVNSLKIIFNKPIDRTLYINPYGTWVDNNEETPPNKEFLSKEFALKTIDLHLQLTDSKFIKDNKDSVIELIKKLQHKKIQAVIIIFPLHHFYSEDVRVQKAYAEVHEFTNKLSKEYNVKIYDYFDDKRFTDADFFDTDHLNYKGSKKLSIIINDEILKPNLKNR